MRCERGAAYRGWTVGLTVAALSAGFIRGAEPQFGPLFSDGAVLQREARAPVWGTADPGVEITVQFAGQSKSARADHAGRWEVTLDPMEASAAGRPMVLRAGGYSVQIPDVLVGDVWLAAGQSNMSMLVSEAQGGAAEAAAADFPQLRVFTVARRPSVTPLRACGGAWVSASPETAGGFSATAYFFARHLHQQLRIPVGVLHASWGGTPAQSWTPLDPQRIVPGLQDRVAKLEARLAEADSAAARKAHDKAIAKHEARVREWLRMLDGHDPDAGERWAAPGFVPTGWREQEFPALFDRDLQVRDGFVWCRKTVRIPPSWAGRDLVVGVGAVNEHHATYVNGAPVGLSWYDEPDSPLRGHEYVAPATTVTGPEVTVALRVYSASGRGGVRGSSADLFLRPASLVDGEQSLSLAGVWQCRPGRRLGPDDEPQPRLPSPLAGNPHLPAVLYNGMIAPLVRYAIRGAIWYQGEANAGDPALYRSLFPTLIRTWRSAWRRGDFPFYFVQLASFKAPQTRPVEFGRWADVREAQRLTLSEPNTGMAVITDIGDARRVHPLNKQEVGRRLALIALAKTYGQDLEYSGPTFAGFSVSGGQAVVSFEHADGLTAPTGGLLGFAVAGEDKVFHRADARIAGRTVIVTSRQVRAPVAARYNWANNPVGRLVNAAGLPASGFRTDDWPSTEVRIGAESAAP